MPVPVTYNGLVYQIPINGDHNWGQTVTRYLVALSHSLSQSGGLFTLTADVNFGPSFGLLSKYFTTVNTLPATSGLIRLAKADTIEWRNNANLSDNILAVDSSDNLIYNGGILANNLYNLADGKIWIGSAGNLPIAQTLTGDVTVSSAGLTSIGALKIVNAQISNSAAIAYNKLNLSGSIVNNDIYASAAIAYSKLSLSNSIVNADIATTAAIDFAKMAALNNSIVPVTNGSGIITSSAITATTLGYLDATSSIQSQLNGKQATLSFGNLTESTSAVLTISGGTGAVIGSGVTLQVTQADITHSGYLSSTDFNTFTGKQNALTIGNLTDVGTDGLTVTGGTGAVIGTGTTLSQHIADSTHNGYLSSTDWSTFNGKQAALSAASASVSGYLTSTDWSTFNSKQAALSGLTTNGVMYATSATAEASTAAGTTGQFLAANTGGAPTWAVPSGSGTVNSGTAPDLAYYKTSTNAVSPVDADASMASHKITNLANGTGAQDAAAFGQIPIIYAGFQAPVQATTGTNSTTTSSTFQNTALTATITPTSSAHRIKVTATFAGAVNSVGNNAYFTIKRNSTNLGGTNGFVVINGSNSNIIAPGSITYIDSPATTSGTAYTLQMASSNNSGTVEFLPAGNQKAVIILEEIV